MFTRKCQNKLKPNSLIMLPKYSFFLLSTGRKQLATRFNFAYRCIDDVLSINNPEFENYLGQVYPVELEIKVTTESITFASFLDLLLSIGRHGQLHSSIYDKRYDFNFHITKFPFLSSNIPASPAYGVFISQLIRYVRVCSLYRCFILRATRLSNKLLEQGYVRNAWNCHWESFMVDTGIKQYKVPLSRILNDILWPDHSTVVTPHWSDFVPNSTFYRMLRGFHITFATGVACRQGTLTPSDSWSRPFGTCMYSTCLDQSFFRTSRIFFRNMFFDYLLALSRFCCLVTRLSTSSNCL